MFTKSFWLGATDRAAKSAAQSVILLWGADALFNLLSIDPAATAGVAGGAAALSLLTSIVSAPFGDSGTPSFVAGAA